MLKQGIYEQVLNRLLAREIDSPAYTVEKESIDEAEAAHVLADYLAGVVRQGLSNIKDNGGNIADQIPLPQG